MVHGPSLATVINRWLGESSFVQVSTTWALTWLETVHQGPCMMREVETWLSDSSVGNNSVVDYSWLHQSSLHCISVSTDVMSEHIGCRDASRGGGCSKTPAFTAQFGWASRWFEAYFQFAALQCREVGATLPSIGGQCFDAVGWMAERASGL